MEWIEGVKLTDRAAMEARSLDVVDFVSVGVECTLRQLLDHGYFHADPHPGNISGPGSVLSSLQHVGLSEVLTGPPAGPLWQALPAGAVFALVQAQAWPKCLSSHHWR